MKWLHFILSHSIFVALCAVALTTQTYILLDFFLDKWLLGFIFFSTLLSYNFYWVLSKKIIGKAFYFADFLKNEKYVIGSLAIYAIATLVCYSQSMLTPLFLLPALVLNALYMLPILPFKWLNWVKKWGVLKTGVLAFTWMYVTAYLSLLRTVNLLSTIEFVLMGYRFLFMLLLCIMFDNRDIAVDKIKGLHSIATDCKPFYLKFLVGFLFLLILICIYGLNLFGLEAGKIISLIISTVALAVLYLVSLKKQGYFFYYFFVDGLMLFSGLVTYLCTI